MIIDIFQPKQIYIPKCCSINEVTSQLSPYISYGWDINTTIPFSVTTVPEVCSQIVFDFTNRKIRVDGILETYDKREFIEMDSIGFSLKPGILETLLEIPTSEFRNLFFIEHKIPGFTLDKELWLDRDKLISKFNWHLYSTIDNFKENKINELLYPFLNQSIATVTEYTKNQMLSQKTVNRRFLQYFGVPMKQFIDLIRFQRSIHLIQSGKTIRETSQILRYNSPSHFSCEFKRISGESPSFALQKK